MKMRNDSIPIALIVLMFLITHVSASTLVDSMSWDNVTVVAGSGLHTNDFSSIDLDDSVNMLVLAVPGESADVTGATFGGIPMTLAKVRPQSYTRVELYTLANPSTAAGQTLSIVANAENTYDGGYSPQIFAFSNVDSVGSTAEAGANSAGTNTLDFGSVSEGSYLIMAASVNSTIISFVAPAVDLIASSGTHLGGWAGKSGGEFNVTVGSKVVEVYANQRNAIVGLELLAMPSDPEVVLSNTSVSSNAAPGTLVGTLTMVYTNDASGFAYTLREVDDYAYFDIASGTTNLRVAAWLDKASFSVSVVGTKGAVSYTNDFTITASSASDLPIFIVPAEVQAGALVDGTLVGTAQTMRSGTTFSLVSGRTDLFYLDGDDLKLTNAAAWGGIGTTSYVTLRAVKGTGTNELVVAANVVANVTSGTIFKFQ